MKKFTIDEVYEALVKNQSLECESDGSWCYYLHYADGKLLPGYVGADESFTSAVSYADDMDTTDDFYAKEEKSDPDFMAIVKDLTEQVNEYIEENEQ